METPMKLTKKHHFSAEAPHPLGPIPLIGGNGAAVEASGPHTPARRAREFSDS